MGRKSFQPQTVNAEHDFRRVTIPPEQQQVNILLLYTEEETSVVIGKNAELKCLFPFSIVDGVGTMSMGGDSWGGWGSMCPAEVTCSSCWSHPSLYHISKKG